MYTCVCKCNRNTNYFWKHNDPSSPGKCKSRAQSPKLLLLISRVVLLLWSQQAGNKNNNKWKTTGIEEDVEKLKLSCIASENVKCQSSHCGECFGSSSKVEIHSYHTIQQFQDPIWKKIINSYSPPNMNKHMHNNFIWIKHKVLLKLFAMFPPIRNITLLNIHLSIFFRLLFSFGIRLLDFFFRHSDSI